jgi:hypothetical protein
VPMICERLQKRLDDLWRRLQTTLSEGRSISQIDLDEECIKHLEDCVEDAEGGGFILDWPD